MESDERVANYPFQIQHTNIQYSSFDLTTFERRKVDEPTLEAVDKLRRLIDALRSLDPDSELTELQKCIGPIIKSNKFERQILLETFGYMGILHPRGKKVYSEEFVTYDEANSDQPREFFKREWAYPVRFWTGQDGVDEAQVIICFGEFL